MINKRESPEGNRVPSFTFLSRVLHFEVFLDVNLSFYNLCFFKFLLKKRNLVHLFSFLFFSVWLYFNLFLFEFFNFLFFSFQFFQLKRFFVPGFSVFLTKKKKYNRDGVQTSLEGSLQTSVEGRLQTDLDGGLRTSLDGGLRTSLEVCFRTSLESSFQTSLEGDLVAGLIFFSFLLFFSFFLVSIYFLYLSSCKAFVSLYI